MLGTAGPAASSGPIRRAASATVNLPVGVEIDEDPALSLCRPDHALAIMRV
jgi:hypothetical protein